MFLRRGVHGASLEEIAEAGVHDRAGVHASHRPELRRRVAEQHERLLDRVGGLVAEWASRWGSSSGCHLGRSSGGPTRSAAGGGRVRGDVPGLRDGLIRAGPGTDAPREGANDQDLGDRDDHDRLDLSRLHHTRPALSHCNLGQLGLTRPGAGRPASGPASEQLARDGWSRDRLLAFQGKRLRGAARPRRSPPRLLPGGAGARRRLGCGGPNPLGLPYARIASVDGRSDDVVTLPGADGGRVAVHPFRLRGPFSGLLEVRQHQVVHEPARLLVRVVLRGSAPADTPARVAAAVARELRDAGAVPPPIEVTAVPELGREPGHGAKFKLVKSTVHT